MDDKLKLVLVDDQEDILETLEIKIPDLCDFDIEMFKFTNLQDATDFIFENPIEAVITDIHLGEELGIDIFEYCSYLNNHAHHSMGELTNYLTKNKHLKAAYETWCIAPFRQ